MTELTRETVTLVRIYLSEADHKLDALMQRLHDEEHVRGVTVFRGITGFGDGGQVHGSSLLDLSLDLPLVVEFYDQPERIETILDGLSDLVKPRHVISWEVLVRR